MVRALKLVPGDGLVVGVRETGAVRADARAGIVPVKHVSLIIPVPPSSNTLWRYGKDKRGRERRVRSEAYIDWAMHAGHVLRHQKPGRMTGHVIVLVGVDRRSGNADIDNRIKPTLDLLVTEKVIVDDRFVSAVAAAWAPDNDKNEMRVLIIPSERASITFQPLDPAGAVGGWFLNAPDHGEDDYGY